MVSLRKGDIIEGLDPHTRNSLVTPESQTTFPQCSLNTFRMHKRHKINCISFSMHMQILLP